MATAPTSAALTSRRRWPPELIAALLLTAAVRLVFLARDNALSGDEAVTGIMAQKIAAGVRLFPYFAGQNYNSAVEQYPQALLFALGAPQTAFVLRIPQLLLNLISCYLLFRVAEQLFRDRLRPALTVLMFAVGPLFQVIKGSSSDGSYTTALCFGLLMMNLALRLNPRWSDRRQAWGVAVLGVGLTGTFYLSPSAYFVVLPALIWAVPQVRRLRLWRPAAIGMAIGLAPTAAYFLGHFRSVLPDAGVTPSSLGQRAQLLLDPVGRMFIGFAVGGGRPVVPLVVARTVWWLLLFGLVVAVVRHRRSLVAMLSLRLSGRRRIDVVLVAAVFTVAGFIASDYSAVRTDPRYLYVSTPILLLGLAWTASPTRWRPALRRRGVRVPAVRASARITGAIFALMLIAVAAPTVLLLAHRSVNVYGLSSWTNSPSAADSSYRAALQALEAGGTRYAYAGYWTAMPMDFLARGEVTVVTYGTANRFPADRAKVDAAPTRDVAWVAAGTSDTRAMARALEHHDIGYRARKFGTVTVFDQLSKDVRPTQVGLTGP